MTEENKLGSARVLDRGINITATLVYFTGSSVNKTRMIGQNLTRCLRMLNMGNF